MKEEKRTYNESGGRQDRKPKERKRSFFERLSLLFTIALRFFVRDMWRIGDEDLMGIRGFLIETAKSLYLTVRAFINDNLSGKASALTYSSVLSLVPMLAVITGVAKGFGLQDLLKTTLFEYLPSHHHELEQAFTFVDNYMSQIQSGLFVGIGLGLLFYTVISLIATIEDTFNNIWQCKRNRTWGRRMVDYMAMFILLPIIMTVQSGITLAMSTLSNTFFADYIFVAPLFSFLFKAIPFVIIILVFTLLYIVMPNTKVRFMPAFIAGIIAGVGFQVLQALYISGILWISKYNAIYGGFAAIPLMLLFMQVAWIVCLFGVQLSYAIQNQKSYSFEEDSSHISRRYLDFLTLLVTERIVKRFVSGEEPPYTAELISTECRIPIRLTMNIIHRLLRLGIIIEVNYQGDQDSENYQPAMDPDRISVRYMVERLDKSGSERFRVDNLGQYYPIWSAMLATRKGFRIPESEMLLKDL